MFPLLAQFDPGGAEAWLKVFFWLIGGMLGVVMLVKSFVPGSPRREIINEPLKVQAHAAAVTQEELKQVHGRIQRERQEIEAQIARVETAAEKRTDRLEEKIDVNTSMTSEMRGEMTALNQNVHALRDSVTQFLQAQAKQNRS